MEENHNVTNYNEIKNDNRGNIIQTDNYLPKTTFVCLKSDVSSRPKNWSGPLAITLVSGDMSSNSNLHQTRVKMDYEWKSMTTQPRGQPEGGRRTTKFSIK